MEGYLVVWIPVINHSLNFIKKPLNRIIRANISDNPDEEFMMKLELLRNHNIKIYLQLTPDNPEYTYFSTIYFQQASNNGLIKYKFKEKSISEPEFIMKVDDFPVDLGTLITGLYHSHEFHKDLADRNSVKEDESLLPVYLSYANIDIHSKNNPAIVHYLNAFAESLKIQIDDVKTLLKKESNLKNPNDKLNHYKVFPSLFVTAKGYKSYLNYLYYSIYNTKCNISSKNKELRRIAYNIENSLEYLTVLNLYYKNKIEDTHYIRIFDKITRDARNSTRWAFISIFIGIVSIILAFILSQCSTKELRIATDELEIFIKTIQEQPNQLNNPFILPSHNYQIFDKPVYNSNPDTIQIKKKIN